MTVDCSRNEEHGNQMHAKENGWVIFCNYSVILPQRHQDPPASPKAKPMAGRHQDYRIIFYYNFFNPDKSGLKLINLRFINKKTTLYNNIFSSLCLCAHSTSLMAVSMSNGLVAE